MWGIRLKGTFMSTNWCKFIAAETNWLERLIYVLLIIIDPNLFPNPINLAFLSGDLSLVTVGS